MLPSGPVDTDQILAVQVIQSMIFHQNSSCFHDAKSLTFEPDFAIFTNSRAVFDRANLVDEASAHERNKTKVSGEYFGSRGRLWIR